MTSDIRSLPDSKLKQLNDKKGGTCTVMYTSNSTAEKQVVIEGYPKQVGIAFSKLFSDQFPPVNKIKLADLTKPRSNEILIIGGRLDVHRLILDWMLSCCSGNGIQDFPKFEVKKFTKYYLVKETARILQVPYVVELMDKRMNSIMDLQVHSEDIRALYGMLDRNDPLLQDIVQKTAALMAQGPKAIKAYNVYTTLAQELKEFGEDIAPVMAVAKTQLVEQRQQSKAADKDKQYAAWSSQKKAAYAARNQFRGQAGHKGYKSEPKSDMAPAQGEGIVKHKTIHAEKRGNGRLILPLSELGVGVDNDYLSPVRTAAPRLQFKKYGSDKENKNTKEGEAAADVKIAGSIAEGSEKNAEDNTVTGSSADTTLVEESPQSAVEDLEKGIKAVSV